MIYIFDVDGTLTPSRGKMDYQFRSFFNTFCLINNVYLVTGSDRDKTIEQITEPTYNLSKRVYNCSGNDVWEGNTNIRSKAWNIPSMAEDWLKAQLDNSTFERKTGNHIEHRVGTCNFSVVGRNANQYDRQLYIQWDTKYNERDLIAHNFNQVFPELEARLGGETGIDITPKGWNKAQILSDFDPDDSIWFFGDKTNIGENDYDIASSLATSQQNRVFTVQDYKHTWNILNEENTL